MLVWFGLTPIVYAWQLPADKLSESGLSTSLTLLNPIVPIVISLQRGIWGTDRFVGTDGVTNFVLPDGSPLWYLRNLAIVGVIAVGLFIAAVKTFRSEEHTSELQSLMRISYAVFFLTKK